MSPAAQAHGAGCALTQGDSPSPVFDYSYPDELDRALTALWEGTVGRRLASAVPSPEGRS